MKRKLLLIVLVTAFVLPLVAFAQPPEGPRRDRARTFLVLRISEALNLDDADALKVSNVIRQSDERRLQLIGQRQSLEDKLREALARKPVETADLSKLITQGNEIDQKLALIPEDAFRELQKVLTVEQQAKLLLFRRELQGEIRRAMQGRRLGRGRRPWQGRGGDEGGPPPGND